MLEEESIIEMSDTSGISGSVALPPSPNTASTSRTMSRMDRIMMHRRSANYSDRKKLSIVPASQLTNKTENNAPNTVYMIDGLSAFGAVSTSVSSNLSITLSSAVSNFKNVDMFETRPQASTANAPVSKNLLVTMSASKRKYSSLDFGRSSPLLTSVSSNDVSTSTTCRQLPTFVSNVPETVSNAPMARLLTTTSNEFATPIHQAKKHSRPNSPSGCSRPVPSRSRIASIRRESVCSIESEAAYEKLVKTAQQVSMGFEEFSLDEKLFDERKRAKSLTEPISIFTNAFLPQSSSPSPTRSVDMQKQCYSPSTQQVVRSNISYSPSPSPTPSSPTRNRIMRSMSPIAVRQISKRRYAGSGNGSGLESDGESSLGNSFPSKRQCTTPRSAASPLVRDPLSCFNIVQNGFSNELSSSISEAGSRTLSPFYTPTTSNFSTPGTAPNGVVTTEISKPSRLLLDASFNHQFCNSPNSVYLDENIGVSEDDPLPYQSFCSGSFNDNNSSTTFSSRAGTPMEEQINETDMSSLLNLSSNSSRSISMARNDSTINQMNMMIEFVSSSSAQTTNAILTNSAANTISSLPFLVADNRKSSQLKSETVSTSNSSTPQSQQLNSTMLPSRAIQSTSSLASSPLLLLPQSPLLISQTPVLQQPSTTTFLVGLTESISRTGSITIPKSGKSARTLNSKLTNEIVENTTNFNSVPSEVVKPSKDLFRSETIAETTTAKIAERESS